jgi:hypothetical protein
VSPPGLPAGDDRWLEFTSPPRSKVQRTRCKGHAQRRRRCMSFSPWLTVSVGRSEDGRDASPVRRCPVGKARVAFVFSQAGISWRSADPKCREKSLTVFDHWGGLFSDDYLVGQRKPNAWSAIRYLSDLVGFQVPGDERGRSREVASPPYGINRQCF